MPVRPVINVKSFASRLEKGKAATVVEAQIGDTNVKVRIDAQGNLFLDASNAAGEDHTGAPRHVEIAAAGAEAPPAPAPAPPPAPPAPTPAAEATVFQTGAGGYLAVGVGGIIFADGKADDAGAQFFVENVGERQIALKASNGKYVAAEGGGGRELVANRDKVGGWETLGVVSVPGGRIALRVDNGMFVSPQQGGGGAVLANGPDVGEWEPLRMVGPRSTQQRSGLVRADGRAIADGVGKFQPLGLSFFWALWAWMDGQETRVRKWLQWGRDHGFDAQRNFAEVGGVSWEDRVIDPRAPGFVDALKRHIDVSWGEYGIRVQLSVFAAILGNPRQSMEQVKAALRGRTEGVLYVEGANEANFPDHDLLRQLIRELRQEFPELLAGTCSMSEASDASADLDIASVGILHSERTRGDEDWRQVRQGSEVMGLSKPCSCQEPPGLESSVEVLNDPLRLAGLRLVSAISGMPIFFLHTGAGIRGGGAADRARGRKADIWEYDGLDGRPDIEAVVAALHALDGVLPEDAPSWRKFKGHWPEARLVSDTVWSDDPAHIDHGVVRLNGSFSDSAFACAAYGIRRFSNLTAKFGPWNLKGYDVLTGRQEFERRVGDGETFRLEGDASGGSNKAVLIVGSR